MNSEDQDYDQGSDMPEQDSNDRYSSQNPSRNPENKDQQSNQQNRQQGGQQRGALRRGIGNKVKQAVREKIDPRERVRQLKNPKEILKRAAKDFSKNAAKEAAKKAAMSPWFWIIILIAAVIIILILVITGGDEENKNCPPGSGSSSAVASGSATTSSGSTNVMEEPPHDYKRTTFGGKTVNQRTKIMLENAEKIGKVKFTITQGSYNAGGVAASAGTHDGGGVVDITETSDQHVKALRQAGFAAWRRGAPFAPHIHAVAIGDKELAPGAAAQVKNYFDGLDGLAGNGKDNAPASVGRPFPAWAQKYANGAQPSGGGDTGGGGECEGEASGEVSEGYVAPTTNDCGGKYKIASLPGAKNYGDPNCSFTKDKLYTLLKSKDSKHADLWFRTIVPGESGYNPNARAGANAPGQAALDAGGAWGLYQMGSSNPPGQAPPAPGKNGPLDRGDVNWELQTTNAINYNKNQGCSFRYWATARAQWGKLSC